MLHEFANAKLNISLEVIDRRPDGFHDLRSIMVPLDLHDTLTFERVETPTIIINSNVDIDDNLILRTAKYLQKKCSIKMGAVITLTKRIPLSAGLGGGSADAAATLRGLNRLWCCGFSTNVLAKMGEAIGSDVPFCVYNHPAIVTGRGERITLLKSFPEWHCLLIKPPFGVSTAEIFTDFPIKNLDNDAFEALLIAIEGEHLQATLKYRKNDLEDVTTKRYPAILECKKQLKTFGINAFMTGSGPTLCVLHKSPQLLRDLIPFIPKKNEIIITTLLGGEIDV